MKTKREKPAIMRALYFACINLRKIMCIYFCEFLHLNNIAFIFLYVVPQNEIMWFMWFLRTLSLNFTMLHGFFWKLQIPGCIICNLYCIDIVEFGHKSRQREVYSCEAFVTYTVWNRYT